MCVRTYGGKEANIESSAGRQVILATVMKGLLQHTKECKTVPSLINAPFLSQELGIETVIDDKVRVEDVYKVGKEYRRISRPISNFSTQTFETPRQTLTIDGKSDAHHVEEVIGKLYPVFFWRET